MKPVIADAVSVAIAAGLPVALVGGPGVGKTSVIEAIGVAAGAAVETLVVAQMEPTDLTGIPFVDADGNTRRGAPDWLGRVNAADRSLLFLDELTQASALHQGVCNDIIQARRVGSFPLGPNVRIVAGYNPPEMCGGFDLSLPTRNRFLHIAVEPDPVAFADGITTGWHQPLIVDFDLDASAHEVPWRRIVGAFVRARPSVLSDLPDDGTTGGFPSPRSLEFAARAAAAVDACGASNKVRSILVAGAIGAPVAAELLTYAKELDLPDPTTALSDPGAVAIPDRPDRAWAIMHAIADAATRDGTIEAWLAAWIIAGRIAQACGADVAATGARRLAAHPPPGAPLPPEMGMFRELLGLGVR
jgi:hypothetical protein